MRNLEMNWRYVKEAISSIGSFNKSLLARTAVSTKKKKKGAKAEIEPPVSLGARELLSMAHAAQFNISQLATSANALKCPSTFSLPGKMFQDIPRIKGVSNHFKWLSKQLEAEKKSQECFISPFPSKVGLSLSVFLGKHLAEYRVQLPGSNDTEALRNKVRDIAVSK